VRFIGLDVHRDFCEVAICEEGRVRSGPRIATSPEPLAQFAETLGPDDEVALECTGNALAIARVLSPHARRVVIAHAKAVRAITWAKVKNDRVDARTLATLLATGFPPGVWTPDERTRLLRRLVGRRAQLLKHRTSAKNAIHATLQRNLVGRSPATDVFGRRGRTWLSSIELPQDEQETVDACLRQIDFLDGEITRLDQALAREVVDSPEVRRLMTIPGVNVTTAVTFLAAIGDIDRFPTPRHLASYLGLTPRVRQSGIAEPRLGRISKEGSARARHVLVEAAWAVLKTPGPLRAFGEQVAARRGRNVDAVAVARKLAVLCWHLLSSEHDCAYGRPRSLPRSFVDSSSPPAPSPVAGGAAQARPSHPRTSTRTSGRLSFKQRPPIEGSSPTAPVSEGCGRHHRGAHLGPQGASSAAGTSPRPCSSARASPHPVPSSH
jgi:transposase